MFKNMQKQTSSIRLKEAFCSRAYRAGSGVSLFIMSLHELTVINGIMLYSNTILEEIGGPITPRIGTYIIGLVSLFSAITSLYAAKTFSRRFLFIGGHFAMGIFHIGIGYFIMINKGAYALVSILLFMFVSWNSSNAITWLYCSEIAPDITLGFVGTTGYFTTFVLALTMQPMMDSKLFG